MEKGNIVPPAPLTPEQEQLRSNKLLRHSLAHAHFILTTRVSFYHEEMVEAQKTIRLLHETCKLLQEKIEAVEPPEKPSEPEQKQPLEIDLPIPPLAKKIELVKNVEK